MFAAFLRKSGLMSGRARRLLPPPLLLLLLLLLTAQPTPGPCAERCTAAVGMPWLAPGAIHLTPARVWCVVRVCACVCRARGLISYDAAVQI